MRTGARAPQKWGRPQVGTGVGKVWKMGNLFAEPQWTVLPGGGATQVSGVHGAEPAAFALTPAGLRHTLANHSCWSRGRPSGR